MVEQGYVVPGALVVASDSHSNLYGAMAALGTPVVRTDAASIWATGVTLVAGSKSREGGAQRKLSAGVVARTSSSRLRGSSIRTKYSITPVEFLGDGVGESSDVSPHDHRQHDHGMGRTGRRVFVR